MRRIDDFGRACALAALLVAVFGHQANALSRQDAIGVCFELDADTGAVSGTIGLQGCYSSSCTIVRGHSHQVEVNEETGEIHVSASFELEGTGAENCTTDCGGAGRIFFDMDAFDRTRAYEVYVNGASAGVLDFATDDVMQCFSA